MKRETREWLKRTIRFVPTSADVARDALATDAEVKRLRKRDRKLTAEAECALAHLATLYGSADALVLALAAALKPQRVRR